MLLSKAELSSPDTGQLQVNVNSAANQYPVPSAIVDISRTDDPEHTVIEELTTNSLGQTEEITLPTPPLEYSMQFGQPRPYEEYTITIQAPGFEPVVIQGTEVMANSIALQPVRMHPAAAEELVDSILIPDHTLYGEYPPKIAENEVKPVSETGEIVLSRVVVPETIVVHDGVPTNTSAGNYFVPFVDYIKNVASSEIYPTWPASTIEANVLAILSFTLNRVYTEWYRGKGYDFTITSSTSFDQKWIYGRNIFESIAEIVDSIFTNYLSRPNVRQPIFTQYCDGRRVSCPGWMQQWGSKDLGDRGYSPIEIVRNYYGSNMYINSAEEISGIPISWPGEDLDIGSSGDKVRQMQEQLNTIATAYPALPTLVPDGVYGEATQNAVRTFQNVFGLPETGIVNFATWYKISQIYVGVSKIAEFA